MSFAKIISFLFLTSVFFLPYVRMGIPFGLYSFSLSDVALLASSLLVFLRFVSGGFTIPMKKGFKWFAIVQCLFMVLLLFSAFGASSLYKCAIAFVPHLYALLLTIVFGYCYSARGQIFLTAIRRVLMWSLIVSVVPLIMFIAGLPMNLFLHNVSPRYVFLCRNPNQFAFFVAISTAIYLMISISAGDKNNGKLFLVFALAFFAGLFAASRAAFVYLAIIGLSFSVYWIREVYRIIMRFSSVRQRYVFSILVLGAVAAGSFFSYTGINCLQKRCGMIYRALSVVENIRQGSIGGNTDISIEKGLEQFRKHPVLGIGFGNFHEFYYTYEVHNTYISLLAETGIIGFSGFAILVIFLLARLRKVRAGRLERGMFLMFFMGYLLISIPHYMLRERWVWLYFLVITALSCPLKKNKESIPGA